MRYLRTLFTPCALVSLACSMPAWAQADFPTKAITIVVPYAAGGASDVATRLIAEQMSKESGYTFIVENKPGAGGSLAANYVARAKPDGYTLLLGTSNTHGINSYIYPNLSYDPITSFEPVGMMVETVVVLLGGANFPADNLEQTIEELAKQPDHYSYASPGVGSVHHLAMSLLNTTQRLDVMHVPYRGAGPAMVDLVAGTVPLMVGGIAPARSYIESGQVKLLGVANNRHFNSVPGTAQYFSEIAPETAVSSWLGLFAPAQTPETIVNDLTKSVDKALQSVPLQRALEEHGLQAQYQSPTDFKQTLTADMEFWRKAVESADVEM